MEKSVCSFCFGKSNAKKVFLTAVKHVLSLSICEGIIFPTYFIEKRMKICQKKDVIQFRITRRYRESADRQSIILLKKKEFRWIQLDGGKYRISKKSFDDWLDKLEE